MLGRQHGLITTEQFRDLGFSKSVVSKRVASGELVRVLPGVHRSTLVPQTFAQQALAAVLWAGEHAIASHFTAARAYGSEIAHDRVHLWVPPHRSPRSQLVVVHRGIVATNDRRVRDGVPLTSPPRTLVDMAALVDEETLETLVEDYFHRGLTTPMSLQRCIDLTGSRGRKGAQRLVRLLAQRGNAAAADEKLEVKLSRLMRAAGLRPVRQLEVRIGSAKYRLDFAFPTLKVAVEGQGFGAHGGRLAHVRDGRRFADLAGAGWIVVPVTWEAVTEEPDRVVERIRSALREAAA